jgi:hypothetical protein
MHVHILTHMHTSVTTCSAKMAGSAKEPVELIKM